MTFKTKLFQYERPARRPAIEGLEEPVPEPAAASDVTIPEGGDAETKLQGNTDETITDPAADASGAGNEAEAGAAPADATLDGGDGSSDVLGDPESGDAGTGLDDDEDDIDPDAPIDYVSVDDLRTTEVMEHEAVEAKLIEDQDKVSESVDDAVDESKNLVVAAEALIDLIQQNSGITQLMGRSMAVNLAGSRARLGFSEPYAAVSLEGFYNDATGRPRLSNIAHAKVALEGFRSTLRNILEMIVKAIGAALVYLKRFIKSRMFDLKQVMKNTHDISKALLDQRKKDKDGDKVIGNVSGKEAEKYVNLSFAARPGVAGSLRILNKQPENYATAIKDVITEVSVHQKYPNVFNQKFIDRIENIFQGIVANKEDWDKTTRLTSTVGELFSKNSVVIKSMADLYGAAPPQRVKHPISGFYTTGLLGDVAFYNFIGKDIVGTDLAGELEALTDWQFVRTTHAAKEGISSDGWLRYLATDEIKAGSVTIGQLGDELAKYEDTVAKMEFMEDEIKGIAQRAAAILGPMSNTEAFFDSTDTQHGWKGGLLTELVSMLNSIVSNLNDSMTEYQRYGQAVCIAWNYYLLAIYKKESELLAQHRMHYGTSNAGASGI